jgi:hypothetical protein
MAKMANEMAEKKAKRGCMTVFNVLDLFQLILQYCDLSDYFRVFKSCSAVSSVRRDCAALIDHTAMARFQCENDLIFKWLRPSIPAGSWLEMVRRFHEHPERLTYEAAYTTRLAKKFRQPITSCVKVFVPVRPNGHFNLQLMLHPSGALQLKNCIPMWYVVDRSCPSELRSKSRHNRTEFYRDAPRNDSALKFITHLNGIALSQFEGVAAVQSYMKKQPACAIALYYKGFRCQIPDQCFLPLEKQRVFTYAFVVI